MDIYTDGSGKTGNYAYVAESKGKSKVKIFNKPRITNNEGEYLAVITALKENPEKEIRILSDSQLIVNQVNREWAIKEDRLRKFAEEVWKLCEGRSVEFVWIPRNKNKAGKILG